MNCAELQELSLALVALPAGDAQRKAAEAHARSCPACTAAMEQAEAMLVAVTRHAAPVPPSDTSLRRAAGPTRTDLLRRARPRFWPAIGVAVSGLLAAALAKHRAGDPASLVVAAAAFSAALVAAGALPPRRGIAVGFAVLVSTALVAAVGGPGAVDPLVGVKCTLIELVAASLPLATTAGLVRRRGAPAGALFFAAVAAAGALAGQAGLHLTCPDRLSAPHLLAFHLTGVLVAVVAGWLAALRIAACSRAPGKAYM